MVAEMSYLRFYSSRAVSTCVGCCKVSKNTPGAAVEARTLSYSFAVS